MDKETKPAVSTIFDDMRKAEHKFADNRLTHTELENEGRMYRIGVDEMMATEAARQTEILQRISDALTRLANVADPHFTAGG